jgi:hypothetical protein
MLILFIKKLLKLISICYLDIDDVFLFILLLKTLICQNIFFFLFILPFFFWRLFYKYIIILLLLLLLTVLMFKYIIIKKPNKYNLIIKYLLINLISIFLFISLSWNLITVLFILKLWTNRPTKNGNLNKDYYIKLLFSFFIYLCWLSLLFYFLFV